jgi:hypothetical protein
MQYVKYIDNFNIEYPPKNKDGIINYNLDYERLITDGYKEFVEVERPTTNRFFHIEYVNNLDNVAETIVYDETQQEADARELQQAKGAKISENDIARDEALLQGVTYKGVLFDSDTDQKVNLLATVSAMNDTDTIIWFGMDNQPLECTKEDLINIGGLITQLHSFCWNKNYEIKEAITEATTVEEVEAIEVDYTLIGE